MQLLGYICIVSVTKVSCFRYGRFATWAWPKKIVMIPVFWKIWAVCCQRLVDRQCIEGFLRRGVPAGYRRVVEPTAAQLVEDFDDQLYHVVQHVSGHILQSLLPKHRSNSYVLCDRRHDFVLPCRLNSLTDSNSITGQLFKESINVFQVVTVCLTTLMNEYVHCVSKKHGVKFL